ncbi:hypothetical protein ACI78V_02035 [Geodermatophilus sp. SYSU D00742]
MAYSRRRKAGRPRPHLHSHPSATVPETPEQWPSGRDIADECDLDAIVSEALAEVSPDDVLRVLRAMPQRSRQYVLSVLGLRGAATVNRGMAAQLLARARAEEPAARGEVLRDLTGPLAAALDHPLDPEHWDAVLGADDVPPTAVFARHGELAGNLNLATRELSPALLRAGLASAIAWDTAASAVALAFLAVTEETARHAHAALAGRFPQLPPVPAAPLNELAPAARLAALGVTGAGELDDAGLEHALEEIRALPDRYPMPEETSETDLEPADEPDGDTEQHAEAFGEPAAAEGGEAPPDDEALIIDSERVLTEWEAAADAADSVATELRAGRLPDDTALGQVVTHVAAAFAALRELRHRTGAGQLPESRAGIREGVAGFRAQLAAASDAVWLRRLAALEGHESVRTTIGQVREAAAAALDDPDAPREPLAALVRVLDLIAAQRRGEQSDFAAVAEAQGAAATLWPETVGLFTAAAMGFVTLPDEVDPEVGSVVVDAEVQGDASAQALLDADEAMTGDAVGDTVEPEAPVAEAPDLPDDGGGEEGPTVAVSAEETPGSEAPTDGAALGAAAGIPADESVPTDAPVPSAEAEPAREEGTVAAPAEWADLPAIDLTELDAALQAGAGAALAAVGAPRRRPVPVAAPEADADMTAGTRVEAPPASDTAGAGRADGDVATAVSALMTERRFGLAADVLEAAGAAPATVAARRLAAYADALSAPTGPLASAFADLIGEVTRDKLAEDRAGQLLALAAAARVALLAPSASPASVLADLLPCVSDQAALTEALDALADASRAGIVVAAEAADAVGTLAAAENDASDAARAATDLLTPAARRPIKYVPANGVYGAWLNPDGPLGSLLGMVAANDPAAVPDVRDAVVSLRGKAAKAIDTTFSELNRQQKRQIKAGARGTLLARWEEALELAVRWANAAEHVGQAAAVSAGAWQAAPLNKLRQRLAAVRFAAAAELAAQAGDDSLAAATIDAAGQLLADAFAICDGDAPGGDEPPVAYTGHAELLATDLPLAAETLLPDAGLNAETLPALLAVAGEAPDAEVAYARRAARGDHDLTAVLVAGLRAEDAATAAALDRQRAADITEMTGVVGDEVTALSSLIDARRMAGTLDDGPWATLASRARALDDNARRDYGRIRAAAAGIRAELDRHQQLKIDGALARIAEHAQSSTLVAEAAEKLSAWAREGHVASAEEHLQTTLAGDRLPQPRTEPGHLQRFFPAVPDLAAAHPNLLAELHVVLSGGPVSRGVAGLVGGGLDPASLPDVRRDAARKAIGAWQSALTGGRGTQRSVELAGALRLVLSQAGLEFGDVRQHPSPAGQAGRQWLTLHRVSGYGDALTPALGSGMSPDGTTLRVLLVKSAPSPTTVLEWMSGEAGDQTVLVLWTGAALSADQRRAIANAARGRTKPPLLWLDAGALAYLACQPEPRRKTFEAIALPFTAASPYRDTPGDTPKEMFYGRTEELAAVQDLAGPSFVSGGRQLGKSALLREAARRFVESGTARHAVMASLFTVGGDGHPERLWQTLWPDLHRAGIVGEVPVSADVAEEVHAAVLRWLEGNPSRALLVLLDEADAFLEADAVDALFPNVDRCRRMMLESERRVKFVFAGLHRTARFESLPNQPLAHLGRPIVVGPLRPQHAHELLTEPLGALGFGFADPHTLPARILALANNMPALLQLFGEALMRHMAAQPVPADGPPQLVTAEDVEVVFADADLRAAYRDKYVLTLNLDHRYLVVAYAVAAAAHEHGIDYGLSLSELSEECRAYWPAGFASCGADDFRSLVAECVDLGVLAADGGRYRLRTPSVLRLLGTEEEVLEILLSAPDRLTVPSVSDAGSHRRPFGEAGRSPLTERQLGRLFDARRQVLAVAGSAALGVGAVVTAAEAARSGGRWLGALTRCHTVTPDGIRAEVAKAASDATLVLADATGCPADVLAALFAAAEAAVEAAPVDVTVAVVCAPGNAPTWVRRTERIDLARVDTPGLRLWCDQDNLPFPDESSRARLAAVTGCWPKVLAHTAALATTGQPAPGAARLLEDTAAWLDGDAGQRLVADAGVGEDSPALRAVFDVAAGLTAEAGEQPDELAAVLADDAGLTALATSARFTGVGEVIDTLLALGCLAVTADGRAQAEPVLAAAVARQTGMRA